MNMARRGMYNRYLVLGKLPPQRGEHDEAEMCDVMGAPCGRWRPLGVSRGEAPRASLGGYQEVGELKARILGVLGAPLGAMRGGHGGYGHYWL